MVPGYNFVFGVSGEHWHINWLPFAKLVTGTKPPRMRKTSWVEGASSDTMTKV